MVAHTHDNILAVVSEVNFNRLAAFAVLHRIVNDVQENLLHAMTVAVDKIIIHVVGVVGQRHVGVCQHVFIHIDRFVQLHFQVERLDFERHAPGFDARKIEQFFYQSGQTAAFLVDDFHALPHFFGVGTAAGQQRFTPAVNRGQRRAQFVRDGGNKVVFHALTARNLVRHVVNGVAQFANLVIIHFLQAHPIPACRNFFCNDVDFGDWFQDRLDKIAIGQHDQRKKQQTCRNRKQDKIHGLLFSDGKRSDHPNPANQLAIFNIKRGGHAEYALAGHGVFPCPDLNRGFLLSGLRGRIRTGGTEGALHVSGRG